MSANGKLWTAVIVAAVAGLLVGGGVIYFLQSQQLSALRSQVVAEQIARSVAEQKVADLQNAPSSVASATAGRTGSVVSTTPPAVKKPPTTKKVVTVKQYSLVKKLTKSGGVYKLVADYAQFLTGKAAADAAKAHGDESPPPNDYYIVNDNTLLRTLTVKSSAKITLFEKPDGAHVDSGYTVSLATWSTEVGASAPETGIKRNGYWLTITDGIVTGASEVWVP